MEESLTLLDAAVNSSDSEGHHHGENGQRSSGADSTCNLQRGNCRLVILMFLSLSTFCFYFCVDMPAALERTIIQVMRVETWQYELLYSLSSGPSVIIVLVVGVLLDKVLGLRAGYLLFLVLACLGQLLFALGGFLDQFWLMVVGRAVLGPATQSVMLTLDLLSADLYEQQRVSFAFALIHCAFCLAEVSNFNLTGLFYGLLSFITDPHCRLGTVLLLGFCLSLLSLVLGMVATGLHYVKKGTQQKKKRGHFSLQDVKDLSLSFWLFSLIPLLYYVGLFSFLTITQVFLEQKYAYRMATANLAISFTFFLPTILFPVIGIVIDYTGCKFSWGVFAVLLNLVAHCMYTFSGPDIIVPFLCTALLGVSYAIFNCSVWTFVFLLVQEHRVATAYGIAYSLYNFGLALSPVITGLIVDNSGYLFVQLFFSSVLCLCLLLTTALYMVDKISGEGKLNDCRKCRTQYS